MIKVRALKAFPYNGSRIAVGDIFEASEKNAKILKALRKVEYHVVVAPTVAARPRRKAAALPQQPVGDFSAFRNPISPGPNPPVSTPAPVLALMEQDAPAQDAPAQDAADGEYRRRDLRAED